jgi:tRNA A37 threonylcarbamoyladenosine dehydratase
LKLADFDCLDLSNMNRIRAGIHDLRLPKTVLAARQIFEVDPYMRLTPFTDGLTVENTTGSFQEIRHSMSSSTSAIPSR